jgi:hypothetical protein
VFGVIGTATPPFFPGSPEWKCAPVTRLLQGRERGHQYWSHRESDRDVVQGGSIKTEFSQYSRTEVASVGFSMIFVLGFWQ